MMSYIHAYASNAKDNHSPRNQIGRNYKSLSGYSSIMLLCTSRVLYNPLKNVNKASNELHNINAKDTRK